MFQGTSVYLGQRENNGFQQITDLSSVVGLTAPSGSKLAIIQVEAQAIRYRSDGTDPSTTVGIRLAPEDIYFYTGKMEDIKFLEVSSGAILNIEYFK